MAIEVTVNYLAVLISAIVAMIIGMIWYSPILFGNLWMRSSGFTDKMMKEAKNKGMAWRYIIMFIGSLLTAYILSHFIDYTESTTFVAGMTTAFWLWLGFIVPVSLASILWEGKSPTYYFINIFYYLVMLVIVGGILAIWP